jgi:KipI family sensor histidine kinase inhibitor
MAGFRVRLAFDVRPAGDRAVLVELDEEDAAQVPALAAALRSHWGAEVQDIVPAERTVLVCWATAAARPSREQILQTLRAVGHAIAHPALAGRVEIPVRYDGEDLEEVARRIGVDRDGLIALHVAREYTVAFLGFAPGFAYLVGGDPRLHLPRRADPRPAVPAGSVAIATRYSAVYPARAPGGWHLLGHTDLRPFDPERDPPALLEPGTRVTFRAS